MTVGVYRNFQGIGGGGGGGGEGFLTSFVKVICGNSFSHNLQEM